MRQKLSVVMATFNEEENIGDCLKTVEELADEIIVVDGTSTDRTVEIARKFNSQIIITSNPPIFHINKQKALEKASNDWILQLDADERVSPKLAAEIKQIISMNDEGIDKYQQTLPQKQLFLKHQKLLEERDGAIGTYNGEYRAFFVPRLNFFLGKYLRFGGVYPDGVIRLVKKGRAYFPCQSVHEQLVVDGLVGWLQHDLLHMADPTFQRYLERNSRYIDLMVEELKKNRVGKNLIQVINYFFIKPIWWFLLTQIRHKGILDGWQGIVFSFFSALRFPRAFWRYLKND